MFHSRADVHGLDPVVSLPKLELAHLRPRKGHRRPNSRHVHKAARILPRRPLGRRRRRWPSRLQALRTLAQHTPHRRTRMQGHARLGRKPGSRPRRRLRHGSPLRNGLLALHASPHPRAIYPRHLRLGAPRAPLYGGDRIHGQRRGQLFPHRMDALAQRPLRQGARIRPLARNRNLPLGSHRPRRPHRLAHSLRARVVGHRHRRRRPPRHHPRDAPMVPRQSTRIPLARANAGRIPLHRHRSLQHIGQQRVPFRTYRTPSPRMLRPPSPMRGDTLRRLLARPPRTPRHMGRTRALRRVCRGSRRRRPLAHIRLLCHRRALRRRPPPRRGPMAWTHRPRPPRRDCRRHSRSLQRCPAHRRVQHPRKRGRHIRRPLALPAQPPGHALHQPLLPRAIAPHRRSPTPRLPHQPRHEGDDHIRPHRSRARRPLHRVRHRSLQRARHLRAAPQRQLRRRPRPPRRHPHHPRHRPPRSLRPHPPSPRPRLPRLLPPPNPRPPPPQILNSVKQFANQILYCKFAA